MIPRKLLLAVVGPMLICAAVWLYLKSGVQIVGRGVGVPGASVTIDLLELRGRSGLRVLNRGFHTRSETSFFQLPETNRFWAAVNRSLRDESAQAIHEFGEQVNWEEWWHAVRTEAAGTDWSMSVAWYPEWVTPELVSIRCSYWEYTGGAHGNTGFASMNVVPDQDVYQLVQLADLFIEESGWQAVIAERLAGLINRRKRDDWGADFDEGLAVNVSPTELAEAVFTITPDGLKFWFAPYEKGAYAEGSFEPVVSYADLRPFLETNGPAKWLPCFLLPSGKD